MGETEPQDLSRFTSIFKKPSKKPEQPPPNAPVFLAPETMSGLAMDEDDIPFDLASASDWDVATRYHEFKARRGLKQKVGELRRLSARAILDRAKAILGSVVHPREQRLVPWAELPGSAIDADLDLDETIENAPLAISGHGVLTANDIWMSFSVPRIQPIVLTVDTSLSMTGQKLALTAVALAVVLLEFPDDPIGIVAFENEAKVIKKPDERITVHELVERFLDVPAQGYTHLEDGMRTALQVSQVSLSASRGRPSSTVLLTDGKYTAGRDPAYLAPRFNHLVVIKMGTERAPLELCRELARKGHGALREVGELEALPSVMYGVVKDILRGRSMAG